jgi:hypothetical protein
MLKETLDLLRLIEKKIPVKSCVAVRPRKEGLLITINVDLNGRPYNFSCIFSDIEIHDFQGQDESLIDLMCENLKRRIRCAACNLPRR